MLPTCFVFQDMVVERYLFIYSLREYLGGRPDPPLVAVVVFRSQREMGEDTLDLSLFNGTS